MQTLIMLIINCLTGLLNIMMQCQCLTALFIYRFLIRFIVFFGFVFLAPDNSLFVLAVPTEHILKALQDFF